MNGVWYLINSTTPYTGKFIDYYLNGKIQGEGTLFNGQLKGNRKMYHLNGNLSDEVEYENGIINGKTISYYSTGKTKVIYEYNNGIYLEDKILDKIYKYYTEGQELYMAGNFKSAIKKYTKCIELDSLSTDAYFARGTAKLNNLQFDESIEDFNKTIRIEPYYVNAYGNRAFALIGKYEFGQDRVLMHNSEVTVLASKGNVDIPENELKMICEDLVKAVSLGDKSDMVLEVKEKYCNE